MSPCRRPWRPRPARLPRRICGPRRRGRRRRVSPGRRPLRARPACRGSPLRIRRPVPGRRASAPWRRAAPGRPERTAPRGGSARRAACSGHRASSQCAPPAATGRGGRPRCWLWPRRALFSGRRRPPPRPCGGCRPEFRMPPACGPRCGGRCGGAPRRLLRAPGRGCRRPVRRFRPPAGYSAG